MVLGVFVLLLIPATPAYAIPAFSRKYQTSCATCHSNFPELNDFGLAFKKNGFKFPKDDESFVKDPPVLLGAKALREVFPNAIYPGEIPGNLPVAFRYSGFATYNNPQPVALGFVPRTDLFTPNTFTILSAGSFGDHISWWIDDDLSTAGSGAAGGLGDGYIKVNDVGHYFHMPTNALNVRFGQFELDLPFTQARSINPSDYDIFDQVAVSRPGGLVSNPFQMGQPQRGLEIGGYPNNGNFWWSVALVDGNNTNAAIRSGKDFYVNAWKQFNLERDPKVRSEVQAAGPTGPRDHTSLRLGGFYYEGTSTLNEDRVMFPGAPTARFPFYRVGGDFRYKYRHFEVYGLGMRGHDDNLQINTAQTGYLPAPAVTYTGGFVESEYWIHPWLIGILRYDVVNSPADFVNGLSESVTRNRFGPGLQVLFRSNIKGVFELQHNYGRPVTGTPLFFHPISLVIGVDFVM
jgi:hypothetical protein